MNENKMTNNLFKRMDWPDIAKGICIMAVIAGHMGIYTINRFVYLWHLPVFFLLAGYFMKPNSTRNMVLSKAKRLLMPYYITGMIILFINLVISFLTKRSIIQSLKYWVLTVLYADGSPSLMAKSFGIGHIGAIWFLWAMFIALLITNLCVKKRFSYLYIILLSIVSWAMYYYYKIWLPLSLQAGMLTASYVYIGYMWKIKGYSIEKIPKIFYLFFILICAYGIYNYKGFYLVHNNMGNKLIDYAISLIFSVLIICLSKLISRRESVFKRILIFFGVNSMLILCVHVLDLNIIKISSFVQSFAAHISLTNTYVINLLTYFIKLIYVALATLILKRIYIVKKYFY